MNRLTGSSERSYKSVLSASYDLFTERGYTYDAAGNLLEEVENGRKCIYSYNNLNQLIQKQDGGSVYSYEYDSRGNLVKEYRDGAQIKSYRYNSANRLEEGINHLTGESSAYVFNELGKRVRTEQKLSNHNSGYRNNDNSGGNGYDEFVYWIIILNKPEYIIKRGFCGFDGLKRIVFR